MKQAGKLESLGRGRERRGGKEVVPLKRGNREGSVPGASARRRRHERLSGVAVFESELVNPYVYNHFQFSENSRVRSPLN